jgi:hypothetical protein
VAAPGEFAGRLFDDGAVRVSEFGQAHSQASRPGVTRWVIWRVRGLRPGCWPREGQMRRGAPGIWHRGGWPGSDRRALATRRSPVSAARPPIAVSAQLMSGL